MYREALPAAWDFSRLWRSLVMPVESEPSEQRRIKQHRFCKSLSSEVVHLASMASAASFCAASCRASVSEATLSLWRNACKHSRPHGPLDVFPKSRIC